MEEKDILKNLNPSQKEAVTWDSTPLLVLAGAGSGKTRILTSRIAHLMHRGVPPFHILGVTFTNKAAQEMKARVNRMTNQDVWVSTFHSTCLKILRQDAGRLELDRGFTIYDDGDQLSLIKECLKELRLNENQIHPKGIRERISRSKDYLTTPYQFAEKAQDIYEETVGRVYHLYEDKMKRLKALDFGDLIMKTVLLFDRCPDVLAAWQTRFRHILIDEYQDTNHAQYRLVKQLASAERHITVVGDPDQSIYAWRGADIKNILNFEQDYPDAGIIKMEQNYRSSAVVLDAANEIIRHNRIRKPKALWTDREGGEKISLYQAFDEREEAMYVVGQIIKNQEQGRTLADQVIFYRMHSMSRVFEDTLLRANIPYRIVGGVRFYDRKEIKDLVGYLRVILNPSDDITLKRVLNTPARGIGKKAVEAAEEVSRNLKISFHEALKQAPSFPDLQPRAKKAILSFLQMLELFQQQEKELSVSELAHFVLEKTRYVEELEAEKSAEAVDRIQNIEELFSVMKEYEESPQAEKATLAGFLESISLMTGLDQWDQGTNVMTMMTLHMAKGLEFPVVYMVGMEEGIFPHGNSSTDSEEDLEEERRICYVGITRAKDKLHMTYARHRRLYGTIQHNLPSRFMTEIPPALFDQASQSALGFSAGGRADDDDDILYDDLISGPDDDNDVKRRILFD